MSKKREFDKKVLEVCDKRNNPVAFSVKGRIRFVTDLHASFRTGKSCLKIQRKPESCITSLRKTTRFRSFQKKFFSKS